MLVGHEKQWEFLKKKFGQNQLSHAYLFTGAGQIGKKIFAKEFVKLVNCTDKNAPCQKCFTCQAIEKGNFPDFMMVKPEDGGEIQISKIRQIQNFLSYKSYYDNFKSVIIDNAEKMNQEAQSCFLKTLEEPKGQTMLFLITSMPDMFLPTIASRCQAIKFFKPKGLVINNEKAEKEEKILKHLIGVINSDFSEKFKYVKALNFEEQSPLEILTVMQKYLRHLLLAKAGIAQAGTIENFEKLPLSQNYSISKIKKAINLTEDISNKLVFTNANPKLALEILLLEL